MDLANHQRESAGEEGVFRTNTADNTYFLYRDQAAVENRMKQFDVLVVDDEPLARRRLQRMLRQLPWVGQIGEAALVAQALEKFAVTSAYIATRCSDACGSGFDLLRQLPDEIDPLPAIVFVTAFDDQARRAFDVSAIDYVTKLH